MHEIWTELLNWWFSENHLELIIISVYTTSFHYCSVFIRISIFKKSCSRRILQILLTTRISVQWINWILVEIKRKKNKNDELGPFLFMAQWVVRITLAQSAYVSSSMEIVLHVSCALKGGVRVENYLQLCLRCGGFWSRRPEIALQLLPLADSNTPTRALPSPQCGHQFGRVCISLPCCIRFGSPDGCHLYWPLIGWITACCWRSLLVLEWFIENKIDDSFTFVYWINSIWLRLKNHHELKHFFMAQSMAVITRNMIY